MDFVGRADQLFARRRGLRIPRHGGIHGQATVKQLFDLVKCCAGRTGGGQPKGVAVFGPDLARIPEHASRHQRADQEEDPFVAEDAAT